MFKRSFSLCRSTWLIGFYERVSWWIRYNACYQNNTDVKAHFWSYFILTAAPIEKKHWQSWQLNMMVKRSSEGRFRWPGRMSGHHGTQLNLAPVGSNGRCHTMASSVQTEGFSSQCYWRYHRELEICVCNCENKPRKAFCLPASTSSNRTHYVFGYLSIAASIVRTGMYPLATGKTMLIFWQIRCLQNQNIKAVQLTTDILRSDPGIWTQVQDGEYSIVYSSLEVLLRDGTFFWKVIDKGRKFAFTKSLRTVIIDKCHLVSRWHYIRKWLSQTWGYSCLLWTTSFHCTLGNKNPKIIHVH